MKATRVRRGAVSLSMASHLPVTLGSYCITPVMLPPGRGRLTAKPEPTGSARAANTIGISWVSRCSAATAGVGIAKITSGCRATSSFASEQRRRHGKAEHPGCPSIDDKLEFRRLNDRQVRRLGALDDAAGIGTHLPISIRNVGSVAHQSADFGVFTQIMRGHTGSAGHQFTHKF